MAVRFTPCVILALGCSAHGAEPIEPERSAAGVCGPDGHVLSVAAVGETYRASSPEIQSVVVSNGDVAGAVDGDAWTFDVLRVRGDVPLVIQLRDAEHQTLCVNLAGPL